MSGSTVVGTSVGGVDGGEGAVKGLKMYVSWVELMGFPDRLDVSY